MHFKEITTQAHLFKYGIQNLDLTYFIQWKLYYTIE